MFKVRIPVKIKIPATESCYPTGRSVFKWCWPTRIHSGIQENVHPPKLLVAYWEVELPT